MPSKRALPVARVQEAALVRAVICLVFLAELAAFMYLAPVEPDEIDCLTMGKSPACPSEVYGE